MAVKSIVLYPHPEDKDVFKQRYAEEHVPLCEAELPQMQKLSMSKILGSPQGKPPYYMVVELLYETMEALNEDFSSPGGAKFKDQEKNMKAIFEFKDQQKTMNAICLPVVERDGKIAISLEYWT